MVVHDLGDDEVLHTPLETEIHVIKFKGFFPAGPLPTGGVRRDDLVQLYCDPTGMRTIRVRDIRLGKKGSNKRLRVSELIET